MPGVGGRQLAPAEPILRPQRRFIRCRSGDATSSADSFTNTKRRREDRLVHPTRRAVRASERFLRERGRTLRQIHRAAEARVMVRPVSVGVGGVDAEHVRELVAVDDQDPVEALAPEGADPALGIRVCVRRRIGVRTIFMPSLRKI